MSSNKNLIDEDDDDESENDADYVPEGAEEPSEDEESGDEEEEDETVSSGKRKLGDGKSDSKSKHLKKHENEEQEVVKKEDEEAKKKKDDEIWSSFLKDVKSPKLNATPTVSTTANTNKPSEPTVEAKKTPSTSSIKSLFDAASGKSTSSSLPDTYKKSEDTTSIIAAKPKTPSGLAGILSKINQQPKFSTLEKSKLDWEEYKKNQNLEDDLNKHLKGKDSYLDRQAFLGRTDLRQFELEKELRNKERKLRESKN